MTLEERSTADRLPPVVILCGGEGTRIRDVSEALPKPLVPVGPHPIVWHIMKGFAAFGLNRFILCLGYKRERFVDYFLHYRERSSDITVQLGRDGGVLLHDPQLDDWEVTLADTGERTMTGGRVARVERYLDDEDETFLLTYGDGVADIDFGALMQTHARSKKALTVTAVRPVGRFGEITVHNDEVAGFHEKPQTEEGLINGGFMVLSRQFLTDYLTCEEHLVLEEEPMRMAASRGQMAAYVHSGFWQCMDTRREHDYLNALWRRGEAPWTRYW